jgi:hypothetical protein
MLSHLKSPVPIRSRVLKKYAGLPGHTLEMIACLDLVSYFLHYGIQPFFVHLEALKERLLQITCVDSLPDFTEIRVSVTAHTKDEARSDDSVNRLVQQQGM